MEHIATKSKSRLLNKVQQEIKNLVIRIQGKEKIMEGKEYFYTHIYSVL